MQTVNTMIPISPDTSPALWESGPASEGKAAGLVSPQETWMVVMKNMAFIHGDDPVPPPPSEPVRSTLTALSTGIDRHRQAIGHGKSGPWDSMHAEHVGASPAKGLTTGEKNHPAQSPFRSVSPIQTNTVQEQATPGAGEDEEAVVSYETGTPLFGETITSAVVPTTPEQRFDPIGPQLTYSEPEAKPMGEAWRITSLPPRNNMPPCRNAFRSFLRRGVLASGSR